jgi:7-cyano-7-deazaguanine synthase
MTTGSGVSAVSDVAEGAGRTVVTVLSGGVDSTVLAYYLAAKGWRVRPVSFDYGQRHVRELLAAERIAEGLGVPHEVVDLRSVGRLLSGSALTDPDVEVPAGHYTDVSMRSTVVANRNAIFTSVAVGVAVAESAAAVALGIHAGDHPIYPDCRPEFVAAAERLARVANEGFIAEDFHLLTPWLHRSKADIVSRGAELSVPFADTWSCYRGEQRHCGRCGTCVERREAFDLAGVMDPTEYAEEGDGRGPRRVQAGSEQEVGR